MVPVHAVRVGDHPHAEHAPGTAGAAAVRGVQQPLDERRGSCGGKVTAGGHGGDRAAGIVRRERDDGDRQSRAGALCRLVLVWYAGRTHRTR
jgi:hypothetical protein